jgi:hypothetical protein
MKCLGGASRIGVGSAALRHLHCIRHGCTPLFGGRLQEPPWEGAALRHLHCMRRGCTPFLNGICRGQQCGRQPAVPRMRGSSADSRGWGGPRDGPMPEWPLGCRRGRGRAREPAAQLARRLGQRRQRRALAARPGGGSACAVVLCRGWQHTSAGSACCLMTAAAAAAPMLQCPLSCVVLGCLSPHENRQNIVGGSWQVPTAYQQLLFPVLLAHGCGKAGWAATGHARACAPRQPAPHHAGRATWRGGRAGRLGLRWGRADARVPEQPLSGRAHAGPGRGRGRRGAARARRRLPLPAPPGAALCGGHRCRRGGCPSQPYPMLAAATYLRYAASEAKLESVCRVEGETAGVSQRHMAPLQLLRCRGCFTKPDRCLHVRMQPRNSRHVR